MEAFNASPPRSNEERLLRWGKIQALLPEDAIVESSLKDMRIELADAFGLDVRLADDGSVTFNPVLRRKRYALQEDPEADSLTGRENLTKELLPAAFQEQFANIFRRFPDVRAAYALGRGRYVVLTEPLRVALGVVRSKQEASAEERRQFIRNPYAALRQEVGDKLVQLMAGQEGTDPDEVIGRVFLEDQTFSERVLEIGLWQSKRIPWIRRPAQTWLPPEEFGIRIDDKVIFVKKEDVADVRRAVAQAMERGAESVTIGGISIPATQEVLDSLIQIVGMITPHVDLAEDEIDGDTSEELRTPKDQIVLRIVDNFEVVGYRPQRVPHRIEEEDDQKLPRALRSRLKQHQLVCFNWLKEHWRSGSPGALLADDMGLGKTLEALTFLAWVREQIEKGLISRAPILIVAPTGLLKNWLDEHEKHFTPPGLGQPLLAYGTELRKLKKTITRSNELREGIAILDLAQLRTANWVLTTYETLRDYQHSFGKIRWAVIVFDEAQKIKTPGTLMTEAAKAMHAEFVLTMTGTPVENRLADLWCILDTAIPGELGDLKTFSRMYESSEEPDLDALAALKRRLETSDPAHFGPPPMLRRVKEDLVEGLPTKTERVLTALMPEPQARVYLQVLEEARDKRRSGKGDTLSLLAKLRGVSLHPFLKPEDMSDEEYIAASARLKLLFQELDRVAAVGEKALVFVESLEMQRILQSLIQRRYRLAHPPLVINGEIIGDKRKSRVDQFQSKNGFDVMLLSPKAGGVGLTLTAANHVFHLSRWWNPAVEDQCSDRAYRIGQTKPVYVYYLIAVHPLFPGRSFDERLHELLCEKRRLCRALLAPPVFSNQDLEKLLRESVDEVEESQTSSGLSGTYNAPCDSADDEDVYSFDAQQFEQWVLEQFRKHGYEVDATPRTGDAGADGVALHREKDGQGWVIQCKHYQSDRACGEEAVREVLKAVEVYSSRTRATLRPVVVTSAPRFSKEAIRLAEQRGVALVLAKDLCSWFGRNSPGTGSAGKRRLWPWRLSVR